MAVDHPPADTGRLWSRRLPWGSSPGTHEWSQWPLTGHSGVGSTPTPRAGPLERRLESLLLATSSGQPLQIRCHLIHALPGAMPSGDRSSRSDARRDCIRCQFVPLFARNPGSRALVRAEQQSVALPRRTTVQTSCFNGLQTWTSSWSRYSDRPAMRRSALFQTPRHPSAARARA